MDKEIADGRLQVVMGTHRYAVTPGWNRVPLGHISQLAVDSAGRVYVFQRTGAPIVVLTPDGELAASWDAAPIDDPHGIFITADDRVLLVDRNAHQILIFDTEGRLLATLGERHQPRFGLPFNHPTDVAVAPGGDIYVSDGYGNAHVHWFASDGSYRRSWGGIGSGPGQFSTPHGIWATADGRVLVGDRENNRVQIFTGDGVYLGEWGDLYHPMDIYGGTDGTIFVTDQAPPGCRVFLRWQGDRAMQCGQNLQSRHLGRCDRQPVSLRAHRHDHETGSIILGANGLKCFQPSGDEQTVSISVVPTRQSCFGRSRQTNSVPERRVGTRFGYGSARRVVRSRLQAAFHLNRGQGIIEVL